MSMYGYVFVGPYATWWVPEVQKGELPWDNENEILYRQEILGNLPTVEQAGRRVDCHRYIPRQERPGQARTQMCTHSEWPGTEDRDLTDVSPQAEIEWFAAAFAKELRALAEYYGEPAIFRWGLVSWTS